MSHRPPQGARSYRGIGLDEIGGWQRQWPVHASHVSTVEVKAHREAYRHARYVLDIGFR